MLNTRIARLADLLVRYSVAVKRGDKVLINGSSLAEPLLLEVYASVLRCGGHPMMNVILPDIDEILYKYASEDQLSFVPEPIKLGIETYDAAISISGSSNTKNLHGVDDHKLDLFSESRRSLHRAFMSRAAAGELRWTTTLYPTNAYAQDAEMSLYEYEDFVYGACLPDLNDPVGYWQTLSVRHSKIVDWLQGRKTVKVLGPNTSLAMRIDDRVFINCDGHKNMPDGEIFTGPVEDSVTGYVSLTYPAILQGKEVTGIRLEFKDGKIVNASADKNKHFLDSMLNIDEGACRLGEFGIGTNEGIRHYTRQILFDEKMAGSFHIALGSGYPESGSRNQSSIHWDMVSDLREGGEIRVDDLLLYKNGQFVIPFA